MDKIISIEYCTSWGYLSRAVALAENLLDEHKNDIDKVIIIPSSGGVFEVAVNGESIFSKKELDRFPEENEVEDKIRELIKKMS